MERKNKKADDLKNPNTEKVGKLPKYDFDDLDLGDADDSSGNLGMDNFKSKKDDRLPSERGRLEEL